MAAVDPYALCPCGSGEKFKWCCHKVEAQAVRAQRLFDGGQIDAALQAIEEGLRKEPRSAWLLTRKAVYLLRQRQVEPAKATLRQVLQNDPRHVGARMLLTRLVLETEGVAEGVAQLQVALAAFPVAGRAALASLVRVVGTFLSESAHFPAALKHLELARQLAPTAESRDFSGTRMIEKEPTVSPWKKTPYHLAPAPNGLDASARARFDEALLKADQGLWASAASAFEPLSTDPAATVAANRNAGLCRLWLADLEGAVNALRRAIGGMGATVEAVDLEALCQQCAPPHPDELVEHVQLIWPIRDRKRLLDALKADETVHENEPELLDPDDPHSPEIQEFGLLDRPDVAFRSDLRFDEMPRFVGRVLVGPEDLALDSYDDGRLDALSDRFTTLVGDAIPPSHPKTKVIGKIPRQSLTLSWDWLVPEEIDPAVLARLNRDHGVHLIHDVWPNTAMPSFGGRTPLQAAEAGDAVVPLRAAVFQLEHAREHWSEAVDFKGLRARLRIDPEPDIDPETVDIESLHLARLILVPVDRLDDSRLAAVYHRARATAQTTVIIRAARALVDRPGSWAALEIEPILFHTDLAASAFAEGRKDEAFDWLRRGRQADPPASRLKNAPAWDMLEVQFKTQSEPPERWVPDLAVVLDRYCDNPAANQGILMHLIQMGLVEASPNPDRANDVILDTRVLQALLAEYGPRITTSSGKLGISASRGGIWTPGSGGGSGGGGVWTPGSGATAPASGGGSGAAAGGKKSGLIVPGR